MLRASGVDTSEPRSSRCLHLEKADKAVGIGANRIGCAVSIQIDKLYFRVFERKAGSVAIGAKRTRVPLTGKAHGKDTRRQWKSRAPSRAVHCHRCPKGRHPEIQAPVPGVVGRLRGSEKVPSPKILPITRDSSTELKDVW